MANMAYNYNYNIIKVLKLSIVLLYYIIVIVSAGGDSDTCIQESSCSCKYNNGSKIIIPQKIVQVTGLQIQGNTTVLLQYYISLCQDHVFTFNDTSPNNCATTSVCRKMLQITKNGSNYSVQDEGYASLGNVDSVKFAFSGSKVMLVYSKIPSTLSILLVCAPNDDVLAVNDLDPQSNLLTLYSPSLCLTAADTRHSLGTTLLIIFFVLGLIYLGVGYAVKYFLMGARGAEAIPNYAFWKDYPNLVREGILFIQNGFRPPAQSAATPNSTPNPNSYDSI